MTSLALAVATAVASAPTVHAAPAYCAPIARYAAHSDDMSSYSAADELTPLLQAELDQVDRDLTAEARAALRAVRAADSPSARRLARAWRAFALADSGTLADDINAGFTVSMLVEKRCSFTFP